MFATVLVLAIIMAAEGPQPGNGSATVPIWVAAIGAIPALILALPPLLDRLRRTPPPAPVDLNHPQRSNTSIAEELVLAMQLERRNSERTINELKARVEHFERVLSKHGINPDEAAA